MCTVMRRVFWLALLGGAGYASWAAWSSQRDESPPAGPPEWPPIEPISTPAGAVATASTRPDEHGPTPAVAGFAAATATMAWIAPTDGACPASHPVKANDNSGIYHLPGGRFYERTGAERCYAQATDAEADGYRAAKS